MAVIPKKVRIIIISIIVCIVLSPFIISGIFYLHHQITCLTIGNPKTVEFAKSELPIYHDIAVDDNQNIHLVWQSDDEEILYQKSIDQGNTWSTPVELYTDQRLASWPIDDRDHRCLNPQIVSADNVISVFWGQGGFYQSVSLDGGDSWELTDNTYDGFDFNFVNRNHYIYLVYGYSDGTYFTTSEDFGLHWKIPRRIAPSRFRDCLLRKPSVSFSNGSIHVLWGKDPRLFYCYSDNSGESWADIKEIDTDIKGPKYNPHAFSCSKIGASREQIAIARDYVGLGIRLSEDKGITWSRPRKTSKSKLRSISIYNNDNDDIYIFWIDQSNRNTSWWGYIPFHFVLTWDNDPDWHNNDLYYARIRNGEINRTERLTTPLSYTETGLLTYYRPNTIACDQLGDKVVVFWSGKRKIDKYPEETDMPYEIYYKFLD
ncbi:MAG: hypothetical protein GY839_19195 [candidate division Zixibacteria bacterium]|nr:hypothetical protein [candidate division Zixibacteria bacterium]